MNNMQRFYERLMAADQAADKYFSLLIGLTKATTEQVKALTEGIGWEEW